MADAEEFLLDSKQNNEGRFFARVDSSPFTSSRQTYILSDPLPKGYKGPVTFNHAGGFYKKPVTNPIRSMNAYTFIEVPLSHPITAMYAPLPDVGMLDKMGRVFSNYDYNTTLKNSTVTEAEQAALYLLEHGPETQKMAAKPLAALGANENLKLQAAHAGAAPTADLPSPGVPKVAPSAQAVGAAKKQ